MKSGKVATVPFDRMPVRSFLITPDGSKKIPAGFPLRLQGIAFSGYAGIKKVEVSADNGANWSETHLGADAGGYSFRTWSLDWIPKSAGHYSVAVRATDAKGERATGRKGLEPRRVSLE